LLRGAFLLTIEDRPYIRIIKTLNYLTFIAVLFVSACSPTKSVESEAALPMLPVASGGQEKILEELRLFSEKAEHSHPILGDGKMLALREALAAIPEQSLTPQHSRALYGLGMEELRMNALEEGIAHLKRALDLMRKLRFPDEAQRTLWMNRVRFQLGVGYLRLGETENCCRIYTAESCIVPIRGGGLHTKMRGSKGAIRQFEEILNHPLPGEEIMETLKIRLGAQWLLNIAYQTIGEYPDGVPERFRVPVSMFESPVPFPHFENIGIKLGLDTFNLDGSVVVDDFDSDDDLDILTSTWDPRGQTRYFRNEGDGSFSDQTESAGLSGFFGGIHLVQADYNNDGFLDVLILRGAWLGEYGKIPNSLLRNNRDGTFTDVTIESGLGAASFPTQTGAWADYDIDGDLDLYVGNESDGTVEAPTQLFRNNGDGTFTDIAEAAGVRETIFAKGATWGDIDGDRFPDLFVSFAGGPNRMFHNNGDSTFTDVAVERGMTAPTGSFATWFWDYNNDGNLDLWVGASSGPVGLLLLFPNGIGNPANDPAMQSLQDEIIAETMKLYEGNGSGQFRDVSFERGIHYPGQTMGCNFGDLDNDGYLDFYMGTGNVDYSELRPNVMFRNDGGKNFVNVTMAGGFGHLQKGHGVAFADLDSDGDQDVYIQMGGAQWADEFYDAIFENPGFENKAISVILEGRQSNRSAIGARIKATFTEEGSPREVYRWVSSGSSFGNNPLRQSIGTGKASGVTSLEVFWPVTGKTQTFLDIPAGQTIRIIEGVQGYTKVALTEVRLHAKE
jgi:hypothetical protein